MSGNDRAEMVRSQLMYDASRKSVGVGYLLWFFLGGFGGHRFYLGKTGTAVTQLLMAIFGWMTVWFGLGLLLLIPLGIWVLIDAFLIPGIAREHNLGLANSLTGGAAVFS